MDATQSGMRVVMFPWLAHGHIFPFLELAKALAKKRHFHIYLCSTAINLDSVQNSLKLDSSYDVVMIELVELRLPSTPDHHQLPPHYHTTKNIPPHLRHTLDDAFRMSGPAFSDIITKLKPDLLIYDVKQPWAAKIAAAQGVPPVYFATSGASTFAFAHHFHTHKSMDSFPHQAIRLKDHERRGKRGEAADKKTTHDDQGFVDGVFDLSNDVVLIKTCRAVEGKYIDYLSTLCERKIVPTGPLITLADDQETAGGSEIMEWLSERDQQSSTLYISFGSENYLSMEQMREIAIGLELSDHVSFIWVARKPVGSEVDALPGGFLERTKRRGLVVRGWAPQAAILAHPGVAGFMSHCGWSSITESMYFGVPVVALPLKLDQPLNARLVVEAGVGVEVERDGDGGFNGEAVARAVREVMVEGGGGMRSRAREMGEKMKMEEDGAIDEVAEELLRICRKKRVFSSSSGTNETTAE